MNKIAIITDTDSSLPAQIAAQYGIRQVPITIHFDDEHFTTGVDIDDALLFQKVDERNKLPTTSAPSPGAFVEAYKAAFRDGAESIICICVSSKVSATFNAATTACDHFPGRDITVIDSLNVSMGQGYMALAAAEAVENGATKEQAISAAVDTGERIVLYAVLSTLKYLALSGRVGKFVAGMADTLNIKPVLTIRGGKLDLLERVRTRKKAVDRMLELTAQSLNGRDIERLAVIHVTSPDGARDLERQLRAAMPCPTDVITTEFTPGLSVHSGSGVVGLVVVAARK